MKLSEKFNQWSQQVGQMIDNLERVDTPPPSVARDYPEAWDALVRRRPLLVWIYRVECVILLMFVALAFIQKFQLADAIALQSYKMLLLIPGIAAIVAACITSAFTCPRCKNVFEYPGVRTFSMFMTMCPSATCRHCGLRLGSRDEGRKSMQEKE